MKVGGVGRQTQEASQEEAQHLQRGPPSCAYGLHLCRVQSWPCVPLLSPWPHCPEGGLAPQFPYVLDENKIHLTGLV